MRLPGGRIRTMLKTILYAEDDPNDISLFQIALQVRSDLDLHIVRDGLEAIEYLTGRGKFADARLCPGPHLICLDIKMPRMSGFDVLAWIRHRPRYAALPVVVFTSSDQQADIDKAYRLGANAYITKPSGFGAFQSTLLNTVNFFLVSARSPIARPPTAPPPPRLR
jgi:CheY-like chemotaxis protein